jgi:DNA modification methylase
MGSGTVGLVAYQNNRHYLGIELNPEYCKLGRIEKERDKYALFEGQP